LQALHWETRGELSEKAVLGVYRELRGDAAAADMHWEMVTARKKAQAEARLNEGGGHGKRR
jgi:hypothetical protein